MPVLEKRPPLPLRRPATLGALGDWEPVGHLHLVLLPGSLSRVSEPPLEGCCAAAARGSGGAALPLSCPQLFFNTTSQVRVREIRSNAFPKVTGRPCEQQSHS